VCEVHGQQEVVLSNNASWYRETRLIEPVEVPPASFPVPVDHGCPFDCGPCEEHTQKIRLPVVTITSACNLDCPICYVHNKNNDAFNMGKEEFQRILDHLVKDHGSELDILNMTGGEPTLHPDFLEFLQMSHDAGIHRVTICTNGVRFIRDETLVEKIAEIGARVALSLDTFDHDTDYAMQGANLLDVKKRCMDVLEKHDVDTTLIPVMTRGVNDHEIGEIIRYGLAKPNVRHFEIHTMTYTGQGGAHCDRSGRMSIYEVLEAIEKTTDGMLKPSDYVPSPCAHPLCYQIAYLLMDPDGGPPIPFARFLDRDTIYSLLNDRLYLEPGPKMERAFGQSIDKLWAEDTEESDRILKILKRVLKSIFPVGKALNRPEALRAAERTSKAIYVHSHMDEETFDTERIVQCCDSNCYADGTSIPVCSYNVLYREKEARFMDAPVKWNDREGGYRNPNPSLPILT